jgi:hypothetical protein
MGNTRRIFANTISSVSNNDVVVDAGALIERLILFDEYTIHSRNLMEIPHLVREFGAIPVARLISEEDVRVSVDKSAIGIMKDSGSPPDYRRILVGAIHLKQPDSSKADLDELNKRLKDIESDGRTKIMDSIENAFVFTGDGYTRQMGADFNLAVEEKGRLYPHVEAALHRLGAARVGKAYSIAIEVGETITEGRLQGTPLHVDTDIGERLGLPEESVRRVVHEAVMSLGGEVTRVSEMREYEAITGYRSEDVPLFGAHLGFAVKDKIPDVAVENLYTVVDVAGIPNFRDPEILQALSLDMLIEIRQSEEARAFRKWIWEAGNLKPEEIQEALDHYSNSLFNKLGLALQTPGGRTIRWVVAMVVGLATSLTTGIPGGGAGTSTIDRFLVENISKRATSSPLAFIEEQYPRLFERSVSKSKRAGKRRRRKK